MGDGPVKRTRDVYGMISKKQAKKSKWATKVLDYPAFIAHTFYI
jgi:hypothetical protein